MSSLEHSSAVRHSLRVSSRGRIAAYCCAGTKAVVADPLSDAQMKPQPLYEYVVYHLGGSLGMASRVRDTSPNL